MSESYSRRKVIKMLKDFHAVAVENFVLKGTPDINYTDGWIELKRLDKWPSRRDTIVKIPHYTLEQKLWIKARHLAGGKVFLLIHCKKDWLLFTYPHNKKVGCLTKDELFKYAKNYTKTGITKKQLISWLTE